MQKEYDIYSLIGIIIAIALAVLSPTMPSIISKIGMIGLIAIGTILIAIVILTNVYLDSKKEKEYLKNKIEELIKEQKDIKFEVTFLKERFKTLEDLAKVKAEIELIKGAKKK
ncbi:MAG: hypothetical protein AABX11_03310 [Nanoarchaeota archaeon]